MVNKVSQQHKTDIHKAARRVSTKFKNLQAMTLRLMFAVEMFKVVLFFKVNEALNVNEASKHTILLVFEEYMY